MLQPVEQESRIAADGIGSSLFKQLTTICLAALIAVPAIGATPREALTRSAFQTRDKETALAQIGQAEAAANAILVHTPENGEAKLMQAMAIGYRAKLNRSRRDALAARKMFDALAASDVHNAEAQAAVGGWHIDAVSELGGFVAGAALGARKAVGLAALDRSVALGRNRAMFPGLAALLRLSLNPRDSRALGLAEAASRGTTPFELDRVMQRSAVAILVPLRAGDGRAAQILAKQLLPFGRISR